MKGRSEIARLRLRVEDGALLVDFDLPEAPLANSINPAPLAAKVKTSFYQPVSEAKRMRAAFLASESRERRGSLSAFITNAVRAEVERLEKRYNDGEPGSDVEVGQITRGAPLRP